MIAAILAMVTGVPSETYSCPIGGAGPQFVFFADKPAKLPTDVVILRVRAPAGATLAPDEADTNVAVDILDPKDDARTLERIDVLVEAPRACSFAALGSLGRPAYVAGYYERSPRGGPTYFHAFWLSGRYLRTSLPAWQSFIVDPAMRAKAAK